MSAVRDERRGHFVLSLEGDHAKGEVVGADLGSVLSLTTSGAYLTPSDAYDLAALLRWWADRDHGASDDVERLVELNDLFDLLKEQEAAS